MCEKEEAREMMCLAPSYEKTRGILSPLGACICSETGSSANRTIAYVAYLPRGQAGTGGWLCSHVENASVSSQV
jgi:hypothetical protein